MKLLNFIRNLWNMFVDSVPYKMTILVPSTIAGMIVIGMTYLLGIVLIYFRLPQHLNMHTNDAENPLIVGMLVLVATLVIWGVTLSGIKCFKFLKTTWDNS